MLLQTFYRVMEYGYYTSDLRARMGPMLKDSKSHVVLNSYKTPDGNVPVALIPEKDHDDPGHMLKSGP